MVEFDPSRRRFLQTSAAIAGLAATNPGQLLGQEGEGPKPHGSLQDVKNFVVFDGTPVGNENLTPAAKIQLRKADLAIVSGEQWTPDMLKTVGQTHAKRVNVTPEMTSEELVAIVQSAQKQGFNGVFIDGGDAAVAAGKGAEFVANLNAVKEAAPNVAVIVNRGFGDKLSDIGSVADAVVISNGFTDGAGEKLSDGDIAYINAQVKTAQDSGTKVLALDNVKDPETAKAAAQHWQDQGIPSYAAEPGFQTIKQQPTVTVGREPGM